MEKTQEFSPNRVSIFQVKSPKLTKKITTKIINGKNVKIAELSRPLCCCSYDGEVYLDEFNKWQNKGCGSYEACSLLAEEQQFIEFSCILC